MRDADQAKHSARVYLTEARNRRGSQFFWTLLAWAANARCRAAGCSEPRRVGVQTGETPLQMEIRFYDHSTT